MVGWLDGCSKCIYLYVYTYMCTKMSKRRVEHINNIDINTTIDTTAYAHACYTKLIQVVR